MPEPSLRNIWNIIAFLEQSPDDVHSGKTNYEVAQVLRQIHDAYVPDVTNKKKEVLAVPPAK